MPSYITLITSDPAQVDRMQRAFDSLEEIEILGKIYRVIELNWRGTLAVRFELMELIKL